MPLVRVLEKHPGFKPYVCITGQHRQMLDQVLDFFKMNVHADLKLMQANQTLEYVSGRVISRFGKIIRKVNPDIVFVQGDTATALMVGIACFYARKPLAHLEAGLRTWDKFEPFPEEMNRSLLSHLADLHFTPTRLATKNLLMEGIPRPDIFELGNTIVDTVRLAKTTLQKNYPVFRSIDFRKKVILVTAHRRESFGSGLQQIFKAMTRLAADFKDIEIVYPVHLNPNVQGPAHEILGGRKRIHLLKPLSYEELCWALSRCHLVLTDSGGIQEEAPSFGKPVLILRNVSERMEGVRAGVAKLVGTDEKRIYQETSKLLKSKAAYRRMIAKKNPYGDGHASEHIVKVLERELQSNPFRQGRAGAFRIHQEKRKS